MSFFWMHFILSFDNHIDFIFRLFRSNRFYSLKKKSGFFFVIIK